MPNSDVQFHGPLFTFDPPFTIPDPSGPVQIVGFGGRAQVEPAVIPDPQGPTSVQFGGPRFVFGNS